MHCIFLYFYASYCYGLRLSVVNKEALLTYLLIYFQLRCFLIIWLRIIFGSLGLCVCMMTRVCYHTIYFVKNVRFI